MTTDTDDPDTTAEHSPEEDSETTGGCEIDSARVTDTMAGICHENHDNVTRGAYPEGLDPEEFVGTLRRFANGSIQYLEVIGDLDGHAVYRRLNEGDGARVYSMPWDEFIERTRHHPPESHDSKQDPAATVIRGPFETLRARREQEVQTGCTCLPDEDEACEKCAGRKSADSTPLSADSILTDDQFRALLDVWMRSDPPDGKPRGAEEHLVEDLLEEAAERRGYDGWVEAYHEHQSPDDPDTTAEHSLEDLSERAGRLEEELVDAGVNRHHAGPTSRVLAEFVPRSLVRALINDLNDEAWETVELRRHDDLCVCDECRQDDKGDSE